MYLNCFFILTIYIYKITISPKVTMKHKQIREQVKDRIRQHGEAYKIYELLQFSPQISRQIQKCTSLQYLTLQNCQITTLFNFPSFQKLIQLQLDYNQISEKELEHLKTSIPCITILSLTHNRISNIVGLRSMRQCKYLQKLSIAGNPLCIDNSQAHHYRREVFNLLPQLNYIDNIDKNGNKIENQPLSDDYSETQQQYSQEEEASEEEMESPIKQRKKT